jgi:cytochrome c-type biogenesis protein CcmI
VDPGLLVFDATKRPIDTPAVDCGWKTHNARILKLHVVLGNRRHPDRNRHPGSAGTRGARSFCCVSDAPARHDMEVYRDQLAEVDRDLADGLVDEAQAEVARTEISRRLLAASRKSEAAERKISRRTSACSGSQSMPSRSSCR